MVYKETPGGEHVEHADGITVVVRSCRQRGENEQDDGR
jgi:hypothetical protein